MLLSIVQYYHQGFSNVCVYMTLLHCYQMCLGCLFPWAVWPFVPLFSPRKQVFLGKTDRRSAVTLVTSTYHHLPTHPPGEKLRKDSLQPKSGFMFKLHTGQENLFKPIDTFLTMFHACTWLPAQARDIWIQSHQVQKRRKNGKWKTASLQLRSALEENPKVEWAETWKMCFNRCPPFALWWYVLLPESNRGRRGNSAQTYLHMLSVYSGARANVARKIDPSHWICSLIKITIFFHWI